MFEIPDASRTESIRRQIARLALLCLGAFLGNWFRLPLFYNVELLFGSVFVMIACARLGAAEASLVGAVGGAATIFTWGHPWSAVIFLLEAVFVALCQRRRRGDLVLADTIFWLLVGMGLVFLFYRGVIGLSVDTTLLIALKESANALLNVLIASLMLHGAQLLRRRDAAPRYPLPLQEVVFTALVAVTLLPAMAELGHDAVENEQDEKAALSRQVTTAAFNTRKMLRMWLRNNLQTVSALAQLVGDPATTPPSSLRQQADAIKLSNPNLSVMAVFDRDAVAVVQAPRSSAGESIVGASFADRPYLPALKATLQPLVGDIFTSKAPSRPPILPLLAPIVVGGSFRGFCAGGVDLDRLAERLRALIDEETTEIYIVDRAGTVVVSTGKRFSPRQRFVWPDGTGSPKPRTYHKVLPSAGSASVMNRGSAPFMVKELPLSAQVPWTVVVESALTPRFAALTGKMNDQLLFLWGTILLILPASLLLSNRLAASLQRLQVATAELPKNLGESVSRWPRSNIQELQDLSSNFHAVADALNSAFRELTALNLTLEQRVEERTRELANSRDELAAQRHELATLNRSLEQRVAEEVTTSREKDQIMIAQSRQAAMGEMIGNIAHQWRQPLNALGLLLANIEDAYQFKELDQAYLARTIEEGNRLIQKMSSTINDFRNFFRPDREIVAFSATRQLAEALSLIESSFGNDHIAVRVTPGPDISLRGFPNQFSQVLLNLLSNAKEAIKSNGNCSGDIVISLRREGNMGTLEIRDNGGGIEPEILPRIFEPYFSTKQGGTGIGLYMSKMIIERNMKGSLEVRNVEGGAQFLVSAPLAEEG